MADLSYTVSPAPPELLQWFYAELHRNNFKARIFVDLDTDTRIIVCRDTPAIRTQLSTVAQPRPISAPRPSITIPISSNSVSGSKAYGSDIDEETIIQLEHVTPSKTPTPPPDLGTVVYTTTSNNKKKEKRRVEKKQNAKRVRDGRVQKRYTRKGPILAAKMVDSETEEDADVQSEDEDDMGESGVRVSLETKESSRDKLERFTAEVASWFAKTQVQDKEGQPVFVPTLPAVRMTMVRNAKAIAGVKSTEDWQQYMQTWRTYGHLTSRPTSQKRTSLEHLQDVSLEIRAFYFKYYRVEVSDVTDSWRAITHRIRQVDLWEAFLQAGRTIPSKDLAPLRNGQVALSQQKVYLFRIIYPEFREVDNPDGTAACKKIWNKFQYQLRAATRWYTLQAELGYGILGLIPNRVVSNTWVQRTLKANEFPLWILVIRAWNPGCLEASQVLASTLRRALGNQGPSRGMKALEGIPTASLRTFGNTATLFGPPDFSEVETGGGSGDDAPTPPSSQEVALSSQGQEWTMGLLGSESDFGFFGTGGVDFHELDLGILNRNGIGLME
jgi:hypothetical protein